MTDTTRQPYLYVPSSHAMAESPRYFKAREFQHHPPQLLNIIEGTLNIYEQKSKPGKNQRSEIRIPKHPTKEQRAAAKGDILRLLQRVIETAPVDMLEREPLQAAWLALHNAPDKERGASALYHLQHALKATCRDVVPDTIKGEPEEITRTIAGSRDKNIGNQLRHMREVYDACADENQRGHREIDYATAPNLITLEREMSMALAMARLDEEISIARKMYERDEGGLLRRGREDRLRDTMAREIGLFERHMDRMHAGWRMAKLKIPEDWALKDKRTKMTLEEMVEGLKDRDTAQEIKPYAELLHHVVAKRAYKFKSDLAKAYSEDNTHMNMLIQQRNRKRDQLPPGENPFEGRNELVSAAYHAKWAAAARRVIKLTNRYAHTLDDPQIVAIEPAKPSHFVGEGSLFGRAAGHNGLDRTS